MAKLPPDPLYTLRGNMDIIHCMLFRIRESGDCLYIGTNSGFVHVWELDDFRETRKINVGSHGCLSICYGANLYLTQEKGGCIKLWTEEEDIYNWEMVRKIELDYVGFCKSLFCDELIISPVTNSKVKLYHFNSNAGEELKPKDRSKNVGEVMCLKYLHQSKEVICAYECGDIVVWEIKGEVKEKNRTSLTSDHPMAFDFCETSKEGILGSNSETIIKFCYTEGNLCKKKETLITNPGVSSVCIRSDGKICVIGCWDGRIRYFTMKTLKLLAVLDYHREAIDCVLFSTAKTKCSDCELLAAGGKDGRVTLWTLYST